MNGWIGRVMMDLDKQIEIMEQFKTKEIRIEFNHEGYRVNIKIFKEKSDESENGGKDSDESS